MVMAIFHEICHLLACDVSSGGTSVLVLVIEEPILPAHAAARRRVLKPASAVRLA
jgi:hypothetical protein